MNRTVYRNPIRRFKHQIENEATLLADLEKERAKHCCPGFRVGVALLDRLYGLINCCILRYESPDRRELITPGTVQHWRTTLV